MLERRNGWYVTLLLKAGFYARSIDFSFLRGALIVGSFVALGTIVASIVFGFNLGTFLCRDYGALCRRGYFVEDG